MKLHLIIKKGVSKKRAPIGAAVFHALSNKKKIFDIMSYYGGMPLEMRRRTHVLRRKIDLFNSESQFNFFS
jgi:hypothetical protein